MATKIARLDAPPVAQATTIQVTAFDATTTYKVTINGKTVSVLGVTSANATAAALQAALAASTIPEFLEATWTVSTDTVTGTAVTAGAPFTAASSVSGGTGTIGAASTTAGQGPSDLSVAANYDASGVPTTDDLYFQLSSEDALYGLDLSANTLTSLNFASTWTGKAGLPDLNANGYYEYRSKYLKAPATTVNVGDDRGGGGSTFLRLDSSSVQTTLNVFSTGSPSAAGLPALIWKGAHASNVLNLRSGSVGVALSPGETATLATVRVGSEGNPSSDASLRCGSGTTLTTITQTGGNIEVSSSVTTWTMTAGTADLKLAAAVTTLTVTTGTVYLETSGTITTLNVNGSVTLDCTRDLRSRTVTTIVLAVDAVLTIKDPAKSLTITNTPTFGLGSQILYQGA